MTFELSHADYVVVTAALEKYISIKTDMLHEVVTFPIVNEADRFAVEGFQEHLNDAKDCQKRLSDAYIRHNGLG